MTSIGMLGGMGPESTAYTYMRMIRYCQERYGAKLDSDFPPILMYSLPVPDVVDGIDDREATLSVLRKGVSALKAAGAGFSFIACNSMQGFVTDLSDILPMLSIVDATLSEAKASGITSWGLLSTSTTAKQGLYQKAFTAQGMEILLPEGPERDQLTLAIREILAGGMMESPASRIGSVMSGLKGKGAQGFILGCTDLPIAVPAEREPRFGPILDTADIIARAAIERYKERGR